MVNGRPDSTGSGTPGEPEGGPGTPGPAGTPYYPAPPGYPQPQWPPPGAPGGPPPGGPGPVDPHGQTPYGSAQPAPGGPGAAVVCVRHPDRPTGLACSRCDRPACPDCLRPAPVGQHCVDCLAEGARTTPRWRNVAGASRTGKPVIVPGLIVANVVVYVLTALTAGSVMSNFRSPLFDAGGLVPLLVADGEYWRIITSGFLHIGPLHLAFNMYALWIIGREVETVLGRARFVAVYGVSMLGGAAAVMLFSSPVGATAGASGAVFGLMGALFVLLRRLKLPTGQVVALIAINAVISLTIQGISWQGHLGGLVFGAAVTAALVHLGTGSAHRRRTQLLAVAGLAALALVMIAVRAAGLLAAAGV
ncbi:rhomboid family intramembrane serine protease [Pseudonocardia sp. ICBG1293]|uniref:rhomboid family intramembrane serine protease n=1 Tax=Pseudonocardia sp. ICBG1293 TaxID=2844382 RepID=UPI001CD0021C|nr:rhomboid family intramembrane serine protease [Pseudonocardia sp. ICBG1293]